MSEAFYARASDTSLYRAFGLEGQIGRTPNDLTYTGANQAPQAAQVTTIAIPGSPDSSTSYSVTVGGQTASFTTDASATQDELGAGLVDAIEDAANVNGQMSASYSGGTLTLTGEDIGASYEVSASGGSGGGAIGTPTTATAAADAERVKLGRVLLSSSKTPEGRRRVFQPLTSRLTAKVSTLAFTFAASALYNIQITVRGKTYAIPVAANTDHNTTASDANTAINAAMPADTVVATVSTNTVTLTAEVPGQGFEVSVGTQTAGNLVLTHSTDTPLDDIAKCFAGLSVRRRDLENETVGGNNPSYKPNEGVEVLERGLMTVVKSSSESISQGDDLYIETASGDNLGRLFKTASSTRIYLPKDLVSWERGERTGATSYNVHRVRVSKIAA